MSRSKNISGFTDDEICLFKAMLYNAGFFKDCSSSALYRHYMGAYVNCMVNLQSERQMSTVLENEKDRAIEVLEKLGYEIKKR